jgi:hypothetical protein
MSKLGYYRYGAAGYDFGAGVTTVLAFDHPESVIGIHLTTLESDLTPSADEADLSDVERSYLAVNQEWEVTERGYSAIQSTQPQTVGLWAQRLSCRAGCIYWREVALVERCPAAR